MHPPFIIAGLLSEAFARFQQSYARAFEYYKIRTREGMQPVTSFINLFNIRQQQKLVPAVIVIYLLLTVLVFLWMRKRKVSYNVKRLFLTFDVVNLLMSVYIAWGVFEYKFRHMGMILCNPLNNDHEGQKVAKLFALFFLQKIFEGLPTLLFLLQGSFAQVTIPHLLHRIFAIAITGYVLPFDYNGDLYFAVLCLSLCSILVSLHYLFHHLVGIYCWWSHHLTTLALLQCILIFGQVLLTYRIGPTCGSPDFAKLLVLLHLLCLFCLFFHYFLCKYVLYRGYNRNSNKKQHLQTPSSSSFSSSLSSQPPPSHPMYWLAGLVKRPVFGAVGGSNPQRRTFLAGILLLDGRGQGLVQLPSDLLDEASKKEVAMVAYNLTALQCSMPELFIVEELDLPALRIEGEGQQQIVETDEEGEEEEGEEKDGNSNGENSSSKGSSRGNGSSGSRISERHKNKTSTVILAASPITAKQSKSKQGRRRRMTRGDGFVLAGGEPGGRVAWSLHLLPQGAMS